jgi:tetratricopeptide (TPR) repeat protein
MKKYLLIISLLFANQLFAKELTHKQISNAYYKSYDYEKYGNYSDAIKTLGLVYERYSNTYTINNRLAYLFRLNAKFNNSIKHYKASIKILPNSIEAKSGLQYTYLISKNYPKALEIGYQIIATDYYNYYANYRLAYVLIKQKKYSLAEKILNKMLLIYPTDVLFLSELGLLKLQQNDIDKAKNILKNVLILDPENFRTKSALQDIND